MWAKLCSAQVGEVAQSRRENTCTAQQGIITVSVVDSSAVREMTHFCGQQLVTGPVRTPLSLNSTSVGGRSQAVCARECLQTLFSMQICKGS